MTKKTEEVLVVSRQQLPLSWTQQTVCLTASRVLMAFFRPLPFKFIPRNLAETDDSFKQLIPYIIVSWNNKIALYQRAGTEQRLSGLWSIGVGGHINALDYENTMALTDVFWSGAKRELFEEFAIDDHQHPGFEFLGIINEELTDVGKVHLGIVLLCKPFNEPHPRHELKNLKWVAPQEVKLCDTEIWTTLACGLLESQEPDLKPIEFR